MSDLFTEEERVHLRAMIKTGKRAILDLVRAPDGSPAEDRAVEQLIDALEEIRDLAEE